MNMRTQEITEWEAEWRTKVHSRSAKKAGTSPILAVCGPSGVGKTTIASHLADTYPVYVETTEDNPYLSALLEGRGEFDAAANQEWFLHRLAEHIKQADGASQLVLDQDPAAIVLVYARLFHDAELITDAQYCSLIQALLRIEETLLRWTSPRTVLCLDAPSEILRRRVMRRSGGLETPPIEWFVSVRTAFRKLFINFPNAIVVSAGKLSPSEIASHARQLLETS